MRKSVKTNENEPKKSKKPVKRKKRVKYEDTELYKSYMKYREKRDLVIESENHE